MKHRNGNLILYFIVVILPIIILGSYYYYHIIKENDEARKKDALWVASLYTKNWDQFITETKTSLDILSLSTKENLNTPEKMESLLRQVNQKDPRYGGIYLLDQAGNLQIAADRLRKNVNFKKLPFIQEVIKTRDTIISNKEEILKNNQRIVGLATPVLDENRKLRAILLTDLRIDYISNLMKVITPKTKLYIVNDENVVILKMNTDIDEMNDDSHWVTSPIDRLPWSIKVRITDRNYKQIGKEFTLAFFFIIFFAHILYLLIKYVRLRRHTFQERKQNELQKLELVGTLAASTAHEIRNPLTGIKGLIQLLSEKYRDEEDRFYFDVINSELKRINEIVSEFLILGKPTSPIFESCNLAETLQELQPLIILEGNSHNVDCIWLLPNDPIFVKCVKDEIKQVILNIAKNAFESFERPGTLKVKLYSFREFCRLEISDNGKGISKEDLAKIFMPFYTSKETGTGLGLVICQRIISSFGGTIEIESKEKIGTTVIISLPLSN